MSQRLILPFKHILISAGYKNNQYYNYWYRKTGLPIIHYGMDMGCSEPGYKVYGCGEGTVVSAGLNNGSINKGIGNCVVIKYPKVECNDGVVRDLACRMFHFDKIYVNAGQKITTKTVIGDYGNSGKYYNPKGAKHLHIEFGTNYYSSQQSIGIAMSSMGAIIKRTTIDISVNPSNIWFLGHGQTVKGCYAGWFSDKDTNIPKITDRIGEKMQKLVLPVNNMLITASYKNKKYETLRGNTSTGFMGTHYGMDFCNDLRLWGSGNGRVIKAGFDSCFGNFVVIKYKNVYNHKTNKIHDVVFRYFHLASLMVRTGNNITKDTRLGVMGKTGIYATGVHTHLEADTDLIYWNYTPTLIGSTTYFKAGTRGYGDTTFNPLDVMYVKDTAPDYQRLRITNDGYSNIEDANTPKL